MRKKLLPFALALCLCASSVLAASAEPTYIEALSVSITLPEGMTLIEDQALTEEMLEANIVAMIVDKDGNRMVFTWTENDAVAATGLEELDADALADVAADLADPHPVAKAEPVEGDGMLFLSVAYADETGGARTVECFVLDRNLYAVRVETAEGGAAPEEATRTLLAALHTLQSEGGESEGY